MTEKGQEASRSLPALRCGGEYRVQCAQIAVSGLPYSADKPYNYAVPDALDGAVVPGIRVLVPFGRGDRTREGVVLSVTEKDPEIGLKPISSLLEKEPVITGDQIRLAVWMRERFFCTAYEAFRAILPAGLWFRAGERQVRDKTVLFSSLTVTGEEAWELAQRKRKGAPKQAALLEVLAQVGEASVSDLLTYSGAGRESLRVLEKQGLVETQAREVFRRPPVRASDPEPITLNDEQETVFRDLLRQMLEPGSSAALLYGVTGSGKTCIYIHLIRELLERNRSAIVLVPEIALTPQLVGIFTSHFGDKVALLHSYLSAGERYDEWKRVRSGAARVVVGTRSAVFAPVCDLGLIIIDEEHETSYKSEASPRYHARDIAKYRCAKADAMLLMGSATPDVCTMYRARKGDYSLFELKQRFNRKPLPPVITADMRSELRSGNSGDLSSILIDEIRQNLNEDRQTILFLNRRGAYSSVVCPGCGYTFECPRCSVSLTYHTANHRMMCHYCGYSREREERCPECGQELKYLGSGTQRIEEQLHSLFPGREIVRMDADTVSLSHSHEKLLGRFRDEKVPILLGTQMVAKGLDFENVTLVGVLNADAGLYVADYRARERTCALISQVIGRAGRGDTAGRAVIQTFTPENDVIRAAARQDYDSFYQKEIELRRAMDLPPFRSLYTVTCSGSDEGAVLRTAAMAAGVLKMNLKKTGADVLGPAAAPVARVNGRYRYRVTVCCEDTSENRKVISFVLRTLPSDRRTRGVLIYADAEA